MEKLLRLAMFALAFTVAVQAVQYLTEMKKSKLEQFSSSVSTKSVVSTKERERQLDCLARNIYYEAGNEPFEGKVAVAQVTINRSENSRFPNDICKVIFQKNVVFEKVICQFSWYCDRVVQQRPVNRASYNESMEVAKKVLLEGFRLPSLKEAMFYHADYVSPNWNLQRITKIGQHIFYK